MIRIENLSKYYGTNHVLKNVNLNFEKGKVFGIVGENGSGKTTLFRCIAGLEKYSGQISSDFDKLKNHLGFYAFYPVFRTSSYVARFNSFSVSNNNNRWITPYPHFFC